MPYASSTSGGQYTSAQQGALARRANIPSLGRYLSGDATYRSQMSGLTRNLADYRLQNQTQSDRTNQDFATALDRMKMQRGDDIDHLQSDYASRGLINSGLYLGAQGDYDTKYQQQFGDLKQDQQRKLDDLLAQYQQYRNENTTSAQQAKADAMRRRAMQYGIT